MKNGLACFRIVRDSMNNLTLYNIYPQSSFPFRDGVALLSRCRVLLTESNISQRTLRHIRKCTLCMYMRFPFSNPSGKRVSAKKSKLACDVNAAHPNNIKYFGIQLAYLIFGEREREKKSCTRDEFDGVNLWARENVFFFFSEEKSFFYFHSASYIPIRKSITQIWKLMHSFFFFWRSSGSLYSLVNCGTFWNSDWVCLQLRYVTSHIKEIPSFP